MPTLSFLFITLTYYMFPGKQYITLKIRLQRTGLMIPNYSERRPRQKQNAHKYKKKHGIRRVYNYVVLITFINL